MFSQLSIKLKVTSMTSMFGRQLLVYVFFSQEWGGPKRSHYNHQNNNYHYFQHRGANSFWYCLTVKLFDNLIFTPY